MAPRTISPIVVTSGAGVTPQALLLPPSPPLLSPGVRASQVSSREDLSLFFPRSWLRVECRYILHISYGTSYYTKYGTYYIYMTKLMLYVVLGGLSFMYFVLTAWCRQYAPTDEQRTTLRTVCRKKKVTYEVWYICIPGIICTGRRRLVVWIRKSNCMNEYYTYIWYEHTYNMHLEFVYTRVLKWRSVVGYVHADGRSSICFLFVMHTRETRRANLARLCMYNMYAYHTLVKSIAGVP